MLNKTQSRELERQAIIAALFKLCDPRTMDNFKIGDTVQLKSGGPIMTITGTNSVGGFTCSWFDGTSAKSHSFPADALRPASPPDDDGPMLG